MKPIGIVDLHCDTLTKIKPCPGDFPNTIDREDSHLALSKIPLHTKWVQAYGIFTPASVTGQDAVDFYDYFAGSFHAQAQRYPDRFAPCRSFGDISAALKQGKVAGVLSVEGGSVLNGKIDRIGKIAQDGVRLFAPVWNNPNELGSGWDTEEGLTSFGKEAIRQLEANRIIVDASHLNDTGFRDLLDIARRPFIASHSNARAVTAHNRNLPDCFIREIVDRQGLIGLNYHMPFLNDRGGQDSFADLLRHTEHFLTLGCEKVLALGSDFDGAQVAPCLDSAEKVLCLYDYFVSHGIPESTANDIFFGNAYAFFQNNL